MRRVLVWWWLLSAAGVVVLGLSPGRPEANLRPELRPSYGDPDAAPWF